MHELSVAMNIIEIVEEHARKENVTSVHEIEIEVGHISGVIPETLEFSLEIAVKGTMLENAKRIITSIPAKAKCLDCAHEFPVDDIYTMCPACNSFKFEFVTGRELRVMSIKGE